MIDLRWVLRERRKNRCLGDKLAKEKESGKLLLSPLFQGKSMCPF